MKYLDKYLYFEAASNKAWHNSHIMELKSELNEDFKSLGIRFSETKFEYNELLGLTVNVNLCCVTDSILDLIFNSYTNTVTTYASSSNFYPTHKVDIREITMSFKDRKSKVIDYTIKPVSNTQVLKKEIVKNLIDYIDKIDSFKIYKLFGGDLDLNLPYIKIIMVEYAKNVYQPYLGINFYEILVREISKLDGYITIFQTIKEKNTQLYDKLSVYIDKTVKGLGEIGF